MPQRERQQARHAWTRTDADADADADAARTGQAVTQKNRAAREGR